MTSATKTGTSPRLTLAARRALATRRCSAWVVTSVSCDAPRRMQRGMATERHSSVYIYTLTGGNQLPKAHVKSTISLVTAT